MPAQEQERVEAMNALEDYISDIEKFINRRNAEPMLDSYYDKLSSEVKKAKRWIENNRDASKKEYETQHGKLEDICDPIMQKIPSEIVELQAREEKRIEAMHEYKDYISEIEKFISENDSEPTLIRDYETLSSEVKKAKRWIESNKDASKKEYESRHEKLEDICEPIKQKISPEIAKLRAQEEERIEAMNVYEEYISEIEEFINEKDFKTKFNSDYNKLSYEVNRANQWMAKNKDASKKEYERRHKKLEDIFEPIKKNVSSTELVVTTQTKEERELVEVKGSYGDSLNAVENYVKGDEVKEKLGPEYHIVVGRIIDAKDWFNNKQDATLYEYVWRQRELENARNQLVSWMKSRNQSSYKDKQLENETTIMIKEDKLKDLKQEEIDAKEERSKIKQQADHQENRARTVEKEAKTAQDEAQKSESSSCVIS